MKDLEIDESFSNFHNIGVVYFNLGHYGDAARFFKKAHQIHPETEYNYTSYIYYAIPLALMGNIEKAAGVATYEHTLYELELFGEMKECLDNSVEAEEEFKINNLDDDHLSDEERVEIMYVYDDKIHIIESGILPVINMVDSLEHVDFTY